jgi:hypothetical protein
MNSRRRCASTKKGQDKQDRKRQDTRDGELFYTGVFFTQNSLATQRGYPLSRISGSTAAGIHLSKEPEFLYLIKLLRFLV